MCILQFRWSGPTLRDYPILSPEVTLKNLAFNLLETAYQVEAGDAKCDDCIEGTIHRVLLGAYLRLVYSISQSANTAMTTLRKSP
jgi:hypothetical protein